MIRKGSWLQVRNFIDVVHSVYKKPLGPGFKETIKHHVFFVTQMIKNEILKIIKADQQMGKIARLQAVRQRIG